MAVRHAGPVIEVGETDLFEFDYIADLKAVLVRHGLVLDYRNDRAAIDTGLHLYLEGSGRGSRLVSQVRVWFQGKGIQAATLSFAEFQAADRIAISVAAEHLRYWYAHPDPVYLAVYVESAGLFLCEDARDLVEARWSDGDFYTALPPTQQSVTVHLPTSSVLDAGRIAAMLDHRSMRIDGPAFRGRPLGHRLDPLRSVLQPVPSAGFVDLCRTLLDVHGFRPDHEQALAPDLTVVRGTLHQTLAWQSPAFAEYGFTIDGALRDEPRYQSVHGPVTVIIDSQPHRRSLPAGSPDLAAYARHPAESLLVMFDAPDLSSTGGLWRSSLNQARPHGGYDMAGLEAISNVLLQCTLVYIDRAPTLQWKEVNYL